MTAKDNHPGPSRPINAAMLSLLLVIAAPALLLVDLAVAGEDPGDGEGDVLSDVDRVIGDALHVAAYPGELDGGVHVHALGLTGEQGTSRE